MSDNDSGISINLGGPSFLLFLVFLILKLTHVIAWSWIWVTAPIWISILLGITILAAFGIFALLVTLFAIIFGK